MIKYDFYRQKNIGKRGEDILDRWLNKSYKIINVSTSKKHQDSGIDRILVRPDGTIAKVEYKFDLASSRTENIFFETTSVDKRNIAGWGWSSQADYWIFLLQDLEVLVVEPRKMRSLVWKERKDEHEREIVNCGYKTLGIPIPLSKVREITTHNSKLVLEK